VSGPRLRTEKAGVLFTQAQNSVRNAMLDHARSAGHGWALPLDGNQFLPATFYHTMVGRCRLNPSNPRCNPLEISAWG